MARPHPIIWLREHERMADTILAVVLTGIAVTAHLLSLEEHGVSRSPTWWTTIFVVGSILPIMFRRSHPIESGLVVAGVQIITEMLDISGSGFLGVVVALYSIGAHTTGPRRTKAVIAISVGITVLCIAGLFLDELDLGNFISSFIVWITAFVLGDNLRRRRERADSLVERAERAEREQELIAHQRVSAERTRIARELHDVVAHSVSVMVIQAAAARRSLRASPKTAEVALTNIEETGRQTMNELRGILGVLRSDATPGRLPQPTLADLDVLIDNDTDLPITFVVDGSLDDLSQSVSLIGYRVLQEALTNVRRHAGPVERVDVTVARRNNVLDILVEDTGRGAAADFDGPGYGIVGMRERVAAIGGTLAAGPRRGGGWRVHTELPLAATPITELELAP